MGERFSSRKRATRRTDEQLIAMLDDVVVWSVNDKRGKVLYRAASLRDAIVSDSLDHRIDRGGDGRMRGADQRNDTLFSYVRPDSRVPPNHPLRAIRRITDTALRSLSDRFDAMYSEIGRPSIPPEKLLRALLLQAFYSIRSERQLMEQMDYNLLFRWFVGLVSKYYRLLI